MRLLVTLGTDGNTDWVRTPDGQQFNLGPVSALVFVTKLALGGSNSARKALDGFLQGQEVVLRVDDDKMWELLAPRRSFWAEDSFIPRDHRKQGHETMTIETDLTALEHHVQMLHKAAQASISPQKMAEGVSILVKLARRLDAGDSVQEASNTETVFQTNSDLATRTLDQMEAVNGRIDELVTAGREFDSKQAKTDIHQVTRRIANLVNDVDLTAPWVSDDLQKLAARAEYLHGLFFPKCSD